jgi:hypothetical protein
MTIIVKRCFECKTDFVNVSTLLISLVPTESTMIEEKAAITETLPTFRTVSYRAKKY